MNRQLFHSILELGKEVGEKEAIAKIAKEQGVPKNIIIGKLLEKILESPDLESQFESWRFTIIEELEKGEFQL